ncbi:MAG: EI24 domain-containing protein [Bacteroidota bacterium]
MSFLAELGRGLNAYGEAHRVIFRHNLQKYLIIPGVVCIAYAALFFLAVGGSGALISIDTAELPWILSWLGSAANWVYRVFYWTALIFLFFVSFRYVVQVLLSPYLSKLSEVVEARVLGQDPPELGWQEYASDMVRAFRLAIRNLIREVLLCFVISFVPMVGAIGVFLIASYYMGFGFMDYTLERHRINTRESARFCRTHSGLSVGLGLVANVGILIPVIGWLIVPTYATVASTLETMKLLPPLPRKAGSGGDPFTRQFSGA